MAENLTVRMEVEGEYSAVIEITNPKLVARYKENPDFVNQYFNKRCLEILGDLKCPYALMIKMKGINHACLERKLALLRSFNSESS